MRKRQKLLLIIYALIIFIMSFSYAPIICHYEGGVKEYKGHYLRATTRELTRKNGFRAYKFCTIDSFLMFNEILGITLVTGTLFVLLKKKKHT